MDTILINCPHCEEEMQVPVGRESVLCMFCGEKIDLTGFMTADAVRSDRDEAVYKENLEFVLEHASEIFAGYEKKVSEFRRVTYHDSFEDYKRVHYAFFIAVKKMLQYASADELEETYRKTAMAFIEAHQAELDQIKRKSAKAAAQMNKNMFLAVFLLPAIKEIKNERADALADAVCREWAAHFKDSNILASDYDTIESGFKRKLCYITTAVCQNLQMGEDCEALLCIKDFRDGYLASTEEGQALIEEYYDIAPTLVKRIAKDAEAQAKYVWIWENYLAPCVEFIKAGKNEACKEKYRGMVEDLKKTYVEAKHE